MCGQKKDSFCRIDFVTPPTLWEYSDDDAKENHLVMFLLSILSIFEVCRF